jgi:ubiquinone/menaquinone biosynthesis C-methylase UbiE
MTRSEPVSHYLLGHTEHELRRLDIQGTLYSDITSRAFVEGGLREGMRVLDIGCGTGDVSVTAARIVGPSGSVVGIDRGPAAIESARQRVAAEGTEWATFEVTELDDFHRPTEFDAVVGRFILMHQHDPSAVLQSICRSVAIGGPVVMIESWMKVLSSGAHSHPHSELYDEIVQWKSAVVRGAKADTAAGGRLRQMYAGAGLPDPECRLEALVAGGPDSLYYEYVEQSVRSMLPEARRLGLSGYTEETVSGLGARLRDEVVEIDGSLIAWPVVTAMARRS